jgi:hypothetical protein
VTGAGDASSSCWMQRFIDGVTIERLFEPPVPQPIANRVETFTRTELTITKVCYITLQISLQLDRKTNIA